jgi:hypothetical protein
MKVSADEMVRRILSENVLTLDQARTELSSIVGKRIDKSTLCRWIHRGVRGTKLEAVRLGGRELLTSSQAINRFIVARTQSIVCLWFICLFLCFTHG